MNDFGRIIEARYQGRCSACDENIVPGEDIRSDGQGGWIHADTMCENIFIGPKEAVRSGSDANAYGRLCPMCFCFHAGECA